MNDITREGPSRGGEVHETLRVDKTVLLLLLQPIREAQEICLGDIDSENPARHGVEVSGHRVGWVCLWPDETIAVL